MSEKVDTNVVSMKFDNNQFQQGVSQTLSSLTKLKEGLKFKDSTRDIDNLSKSVKDVTFDKLSDGVSTIANKFTNLGIVGVTALQNIVNKAVNAGERIVSALTIDPVKLGFQEYETQINAIQTILANTESKGTTLNDVNDALDELNHYADMTIYNFTEMTRNIGTFTAAGVDLDTSVSAIKGIANLAAVSGSTSQQASTAMYQLSQALAAGTVKLIDWNSVVNAGMGGQVFQDALKETARVHGIEIDKMIKDEGSFRETLSKGWLSSEILTETLSKFTGDLTEKQLKSMGYNKEQIKDILKMGETANDAATKVKTFTQLFDTLQEAAQSGWTQTWEILIGDFDEAKKLLTNVSDVVSNIINESANARNELLQGWKDQGGRTMIIDSLAHGFEVISDLIAPVKEAMNEIFPPVTSEQLISLTKGITDLINGFEVTDETAQKIKNTFSGLFSILKVGVTAVKLVANGFKSLITFISPLAGIILDFTSLAGSKITDFVNNLGDFSDLDSGPLRDFVDSAKTAFDEGSVLSNVGSTLGNIFKNIYDRIKERIEPFKNLATNIWNFIHDLIEVLISAAPSFEEIAEAFDKVFQKIRDVISNAMEGIDFNSGIDVINTGMLAGIVVMLRSFVKTLKKTSKEAGDNSLVSKIKDILDGVKDSLKAWQANINSKTILTIAAAIGVLAVSLIALSLIDSAKLTTALAGITVLFIELFASLTAFSKISNGKGFLGLTKVSVGFVGLSVAVLVLSSAVSNLSKLDWSGLAKGLLGVGVVLASLAGFLKIANGLKIKPSTGVGLIALAGALVIITNAVERLGNLNITALIKGLTSLSVALAAMALAMKSLDGMKKATSIGTGMLLMASAMIVLSVAVERLGNLNPEVLAKGLLGLSVSLLAMSAAMKVMGNIKGAVSIGVGLIGMATSMVILSNAVEKLGSMDAESLAKGLISIAAALTVITVAVNLMPTSLPIIASGLLIFSGALIVIAGAMAILGNFSGESIGKSLTALGGSLAILSIALNAMQGTLSGSAALLIASAALMALTPALYILGSMSLSQIGTALIAIAGALALFGGAAALLQPLIPSILALSASLSLFGVACLAVGAGVALLAAGLTLLGGSGVAVSAALTAIITTLAGSIPLIITKVGEGLISLVQLIGDSASTIATAIGQVVSAILTTLTSLVPQLGTLISTIVTEVLRVLTEAVPQLGTLISTAITEVLRILTEAIPQFAEAGLQIIVGILTGLASNIGDIVTAGADVIVNFLQGIQDNIGRIVDEGIQTAISFINGIADGLRNNKEEIWDALENLVDAIIEFFVTGAQDLLDIGGDILDGIGQGISDAIGHIGDFLVGLPGAIADFLNPTKLMDAGAEFFSGIFGGGDNGESEAEEVGENISTSTSEGIESKASEVSNSAETSVSDANSKADAKTSSFVSVGKNIASGTASGITNNSYLVSNAAEQMVSDAEKASKKKGVIKSPSRLFMNNVGRYIAEGCALGISKFDYMVAQASGEMVLSAFDEATDSLFDFSDILNTMSFDDISPTITPVVDLSNVENGSKLISSMFNQNLLYSANGDSASRLLPSISGSNLMGQAIASNLVTKVSNMDVVSAINKMSSKMDSIGPTYNNYMSGITYDDGTNIANAIQTIAHEIKMDGRS